MLLTLIGLAAGLHAASSGYPIVTTFSARDIGGDATTKCWSAVQDLDGVMHFGRDGIVHYDGTHWSVTPVPGAYALRGLAVGADGRLWYAGNGDIGWLERDGPGRWKPHSLRSQLSAEESKLGEVWQVLTEGDGAVFITGDRVLRWDGSAFRSWSLPGGRRIEASRCAGTIYIDHEPSGLYALTAEGPKLVIPVSLLHEAFVYAMEPRDHGWLLLTSKGIFTFADGQLTLIEPELAKYISASSMVGATRLADGRFALGTYRGGIVIVRADGSLDRILTEQDGLPTRVIFSVYADREGGLWATSDSHIFHVAVNSPTTVFDERAGLPKLPVLNLTRQDGRLFVALDPGVYSLNNDNMHFQPVAGLKRRTEFLRSSERGLLVTDNHTVQAFNPVSGLTTLCFTPFGPQTLLPSLRSPGRILLSSSREIILIEADGHSRILVKNLPDIPSSLAEDANGGLWIGTSVNGLLYAQPEPDSPVEALAASGRNGLPPGHGLCIVTGNPGGDIFVFTPGEASFLRRGTATFEGVLDFPRRDVSVLPAAMADDSVWLALSSSGSQPATLARIALVGAHAVWQPHTAEGLASIGEPRSLLAETVPGQGAVIWVGGTEGLLRNVVGASPTAPTPRPPLLHAFARRAKHSELDPITSALPYATGSVVFEFAAPEFSGHSTLRLETRMTGVDNDWIPAEPGGRRVFTAMREGSYLFQVRVVAETGRASEPVVFRFEIAPPWWRSTPAALAALVLGVMLIYGVFRFREHALRRRNAELEEKVRTRTVELELASAAKTQFVANMSHDIRNPLNGIIGLALALDDTPLDARQRELIATLRECTAYLATLVDDVLDFASIEAGRVELRPGPFAPAELLRSVVATLRAETVQSGATLVVEASPDLPATVTGDAGRIQQILINYVGNALKYAGGRIRLSARVPDGAPGQIEFAVTDEGPGISETDLPRLFSKFTRLAQQPGAQIEGTGLGLASCKLLAELMDGSVGAESQPGHGARFTLRLPLAPAAEVPAPAVPAVSLPAASVLLVEDTNYNAWAANAVLAKLGLTATRAHTGAEALELFASHRFNIVLLDRNLPDMDGTEVARRMRATEENGQHALLLAVTAYCTAEDRELCLKAGMDAFVGKPLTPEKLRRTLLSTGRQLLAAAPVQAPPELRNPPIDLTLLGYLSDGTPQGLEAQVARFLTVLTEAEVQLQCSAAEGDFNALADTAHGVLSQARLIGSTPLCEAAVDLEQAARAQPPSGCGELLARVRVEISIVTAALRHPHRALHSR